MFHKIHWQYSCWLPHTDFFFSFSCSIVFNMLGATVLILAHWVHWLTHKSVDIQPVHEKYSMRKYGESSPSRWFDLIIQTQHLWSTGTHNITKTTVHHWIQETPNNLLFWASSPHNMIFTVHFLPVWSKSLIGRIWADKQCYSFHFQQL